MSSTDDEDEMQAALTLRRAALAARLALRPAVEDEGVAALRRLLPVAQSDSGQSRRVARFLLGLYNGTRFPFDLTDLRGLDFGLHDDCLAVLRMDHSPQREVHRYFEDGGAVFEELASDWGWAEK
jgi:hypothetical protein